MSSRGATVFTIGHSNHSLEVFVNLLAQHRVSVLADVRSAPYSRFNPHFNRESLSGALKASEIEYAYFGRELGGRPSDSACYEGGRVCYDRVAKTRDFRQGLGKVMNAANKQRVALMCAEKEPLDCHRTLLVAQALDARGVSVHHILADGGLEDHAHAISRLVRQHDLSPEGDMFATREESISLAIAHHAEQVAFAAQRDSEQEVP